MRGSKYELKFDFKGQPVNEEEIRHVLKKDKKGATNNHGKKSGGGGGGGGEEEKMSV